MRRFLGLALLVSVLVWPTDVGAATVAPAGDVGPRAVSKLAVIRAMSERNAAPAALGAVGGSSAGDLEVGNTIPVGPAPLGEAFDPDRHTLYVTHVGGDTVAVIDTAACNGTVRRGCGGPVAEIPVGPGPLFPAIDPASHTLYVPMVGAADDGTTVAVVDTSSCNAATTVGCGVVAATVDIGSLPVGAAIDRAHHTIYVPNPVNGTVSMIDMDTCKATDTSGCATVPMKAEIGGGPDSLDVDAEHHTLYVASSGFGIVSMFDTDTCNASTSLGCTDTLRTVPAVNPWWVTVDPQSDTVYVPNYATEMVTMIDTRTCSADPVSICASPPRTRLTGTWPIAVGLDPDTHTAYVSLYGGSVVSLLDTRSCNARTDAGCRLRRPDLRVGRSPNAVVVDREHHSVFTSNDLDNTVSAVDMARCNSLRTSGCRKPWAPLQVRPSPGAMGVDPATDTIYVAHPDNLEMIDGRSCNRQHLEGCRSRPQAIPMFEPVDIAVDQQTVYVTNLSSGTITMLDRRTCNAHTKRGCAKRSLVHLGNDSIPAGMATNSRTHTLYVTLAAENAVAVLDTATCNIDTRSGCGADLARAPVGSGSFQMAVNRNTNTVYVGDFESPAGFGTQVFVIDGRQCSALDASGCADASRPFSLGPLPGGLAVDETTNTLYATFHKLESGDLGTVSVIDGLTCNGQTMAGCETEHPELTVGFNPLDASIDPRTHTLYVAEGFDSSVSIVDVTECNRSTSTACASRSHRVEVGNLPHYSVFDPATGTVYVSNSSSADISVLGPNSGH